MFVRYYFVPGKQVAWAAAAPHTNATPASPLVENMGARSRCANATAGGGACSPLFPRSGGVSPKLTYNLTKSFLKMDKREHNNLRKTKNTNLDNPPII